MEDPVADIARLFARSGDARLIEAFLRQILTGDELKAVGSRWQLVRMLRAGRSQRDISRSLGLSLCKITRGSRELKKKDGAFLKVLKAEEKRHG